MQNKMAFLKKCCAVSVVLFAVLLGLLFGGFLQPLFTFQDGYKGERGTFMKGMFPVHHKGIPWGFTLEEMPDLKGACGIHSCAVADMIFMLFLSSCNLQRQTTNEFSEVYFRF